MQVLQPAPKNTRYKLVNATADVILQTDDHARTRFNPKHHLSYVLDGVDAKLSEPGHAPSSQTRTRVPMTEVELTLSHRACVRTEW